VINACFETEDMMIDHDARPALIYVPNSAELPGPSRASALTRAAELSADDRGDAMSSIEQLGTDRWRARWRDPGGRQKAKTFTKYFADH
jgi:hypothetical protein